MTTCPTAGPPVSRTPPRNATGRGFKVPSRTTPRPPETSREVKAAFGNGQPQGGSRSPPGLASPSREREGLRASETGTPGARGGAACANPNGSRARSLQRPARIPPDSPGRAGRTAGWNRSGGLLAHVHGDRAKRRGPDAGDPGGGSVPDRGRPPRLARPEGDPREADRRRGDRRRGEVDPGLPPQALARVDRPPRLLHGVELLRPRAGGDPAREEGEPPHRDDLLPHPRHGLRRPLRAPDPPAPPRRLHRALRPLLLHRLRA